MDVLVVNRLRAGACLRRCCGSQHRRAVAYAAAKLSELQNCAPALSGSATE